MESIIDFRLKELRAKVAVIEKFETQVETLTQVAKDLEGKLPEALEQGLKQNRPEVLMVTIFKESFYSAGMNNLCFTSLDCTRCKRMICINLFQNLRKDFELTVKKVKSVEEEIATDFANLNLSIPRLVTEEVCSI